MEKWLKITLLVIFGLALVSVVLYISGMWDRIYDLVFNRNEGQIWINILLIAVMAGAIIAVLKGKGSSDDSSSDSSSDD